jgi:hypothetical protein
MHMYGLIMIYMYIYMEGNRKKIMIHEHIAEVGYLEGLRMPVTSLRMWILSWLRLKPSMVVSSCRYQWRHLSEQAAVQKRSVGR